MRKQHVIVAAALFTTLSGTPDVATDSGAAWAQSTVICSPVADTRLEEKAPTTNYATAPTLWGGGNVNGVGQFAEAVLKFNCPPLPSSATITAATLKLHVTNSTTSTYELFELRKPWSETEATWTNAAIGQAWQVTGARGPTDRGSSVLGRFSSTPAGQLAISLTAAGRDVVSGWINGTTANNGLVLRPPLSHDDVGFASRETATAPTLVVDTSAGQVTLPAVEDTRLEEKAQTTNYATATTLWGGGNVNGLGQFAEAVMRFDVTLIPSGANIQGATLNLNVTATTADTYELYELKKPWTETGATWVQFASGASWEVPGAKGSTDRGNTILGAFTGATIGMKSSALNADGLALLAGWASGTIANNGILLRAPLAHNDIGFNSSENTNPPVLEITYTLSISRNVKFLQLNIYKGRYWFSSTDNPQCNLGDIADYVLGEGSQILSLNEVMTVAVSFSGSGQRCETQFGGGTNRHQGQLLEQLLEQKSGVGWTLYYQPSSQQTGSSLNTGGNALLWRNDLPDAGWTLSSTDTAYHQYATPNPRVVVTVTLPINQRQISFFSTHLVANGTTNLSSERQEQVRQLKTFALTRSGVRIIAGDFNATLGSPEIALMTSEYMDTGHDAGPTRPSGSRIDYQFIDNGSVGTGAASVLAAEVRQPKRPSNPRYDLSDHYPLTVTYAIK